MENFIEILKSYIESVGAVTRSFEWFEVLFIVLAGVVAGIIGLNFNTLMSEWNNTKLKTNVILTAILVGALTLAIAIAFPLWTKGLCSAAILWVLWCFIVGCEKISFVALIMLLVYFFCRGLAGI